MGRKLKGKALFDVVEKFLDDVDEETGKTYRELIALQIVKTAAGKGGGARETMTAALSILDRLEKRPQKAKGSYLDKVADRTKHLEKYKVDYDE